MRKNSTPTFIHKLKLNISKKDKEFLKQVLNSNRQMYNHILGVGLRRLKLRNESKDFQKLIKEYRIYKKLPDNQKTKTITTSFNQRFKELNEKFLFTQGHFQKVATTFKNVQFNKLLDADIPQKTADKLFKTLSEYSIGKKGRPRFKKYEELPSIEGKSNKSGLTFKEGKFVYKKRIMDLIFDKKDIYNVESHALNQRVKFCSLKMFNENNKENYYLYLHLEGIPLQKEKNKTLKKNFGKKVSIDNGPSCIAIVSENKNIITLERINQEIIKMTSKKKELQRKLQRKLRINNLDNFEEDFIKLKGRTKVKKKGKIKSKSNRKPWNISNIYKKVKEQLKEIQRKETLKRKYFQQELANKLQKEGNVFVMEKISYKGWQKMFGRSLLNSAPSQFKEILSKKAKYNGGDLIEYNTQTTALSQTCLCGSKKKKSLTERFHNCDCGIIQQRDLFSAYLGLFVELNTHTLDIVKANKSYQRFKHPLEVAVLKYQNSSSSFMKTLGLSKSQLENFASLIQMKRTTVSKNVVNENIEKSIVVIESLDLGCRRTNLPFEINTLNSVELENYIFSNLKPTHFSVW